MLLLIPSSRPNPQTFPQFVWVHILRFLAAEMTVLKRMFQNFFILFLKFIPQKPRQNSTNAIFTYP